MRLSSEYIQYYRYRKYKLIIGILSISNIITILFVIVLVLSLTEIQKQLKYNSITNFNYIESKNIDEKLGKIILLPNSKYEVGQIQNIEILKKQMPLVYENAQNGDYLFIFSDRMIIYRDSENKIINYVYLTNK